MTGRVPRNSMLAVLLAALMTGATGMGGQVLAASDVHFSPLPFVNLANQVFGEETVLDAVEALTGQAQVSAGSDRRITVLMVGSDFRAGRRNGERTDTILVMSINPNSGQISAASIPRDMSHVRIAPSLGGGTFTTEINGMFKWFKKRSGGNRNVGLEKLRVEIEYLLATPIDYVAYIRFDGFDALVDEAAGIPTNIPAELRDPDYIDYPTYPTGAKFLADNDALLRGADAPRCYGGYPKPVTNWGPVPNCTRALVYVRSRHGRVGTQSNNDYMRSRRQQAFIFDALKHVRASYARTQNVRELATSIPTNFYTTIPIGTASDGLALYNLVQGAYMPSTAQVVFSPTTYATRVDGHWELKLSAVRAWCDKWMGPV